MRARIVLADDHVAFLEMATRMIETEYDVIETFRDGRRVVESVGTLAPDVLVLDIAMPECHGIEIARRLQSMGNPVKIVFLTVHEDPDYLRCALDAGALGYVIKRRLATDLMPALGVALVGRRFISEPLSGGAQSVAAPDDDRKWDRATPPDQLPLRDSGTDHQASAQK